MKLVSLSLREWRSFQSCDLEFPDGLIGVRGANGSGKTTIAEAIGWALFGKLRAGAKVGDLKRQGATDASSVELTFRLGSTIYRVRRVVGGAATLWIGDGDESESTQTRATNQAIVRELGIGWESFQRTVFARQKDVAALDPSATKQSRTDHVERLLGLRRYRDASTAAKARAKELASQLAGLREEAPNLGDLRAQLKLAAEAAAAGSPAVEAAQTVLAGARGRALECEAAVDAEHERVSRSKELTAKQSAAANALETVQGDLESARDRAEKRAAHTKRLEALRANAPDLEVLRLADRRWRALETCDRELADVCEEGATFDGDAAALRSARLKVVRDAIEHLHRTPVPDPAPLRARVAALQACSDLPPAQQAAKDAETIELERDDIRAQLATATARMKSDSKHLAALDDNGAEVPCPICLRPYGEDFDRIRTQHEQRLEQTRHDIAALTLRCNELETRRQQARDIAARASNAAEALARTPGLDDLGDARAAADAAAIATAARATTLAALCTERDDLEAAVANDYKAERATAQARAARNVTRERFEAAAIALGVDSFDAAAFAVATAARGEAEEVVNECRQLEAALGATAGLAREIVVLECRRETHAGEVESMTRDLAVLALDTARLPALRLALQDAKQAVEEAVEALQEARLQAQGSDQSVKDLRARLEAAEEIHAKIEQRAREHREHNVAADLLADFRSAQSARAWPNLELGAGRLLSDTTDGRYADVRMSIDYKLEVVDRGERFGLERFSGGEQDLANLCLRLAIADWVARERGMELGFVVLDEVFGSQDDDRRQRLLDALRSLGARFHQLLVITHVADIADLCDHQLVVTLAEPGRSNAEIRSA